MSAKYQKKYVRGEPIKSIEEFLSIWRDSLGVHYVYWDTKIMHVNFIAAMHLMGIAYAIDRRVLYRAERTCVTCRHYPKDCDLLLQDHVTGLKHHPICEFYEERLPGGVINVSKAE